MSLNYNCKQQLEKLINNQEEIILDQILRYNLIAQLSYYVLDALIMNFFKQEKERKQENIKNNKIFNDLLSQLWNVVHKKIY